MKLLKALPIIVLSVLLTGCFDRGSRNANLSCDLSNDSSIAVEGYSNEQMAQSKEWQAMYAIFTDETKSNLSKADQAHRCLEEEFKNSQSKENFRTIIGPYIDLALTYIFEVAFWIFVAFLSWSIAVDLPIILATRPKEYNPNMGEFPVERYPAHILRKNLIKIGLIIALFIPASTFNMGSSHTNLYTRYFKFKPYEIGMGNFTYTVSTTIAEIMRGKNETTILTDVARLSSPLAFKAWAMTNFQVKGQLLDNRTAKVEYHEATLENGKYVLRVEHPDSMPYIYSSGNKIEFKRLTMEQDDKTKQKVRNQLSFSGAVKFDTAVISKEAQQLIAASPDLFVAKSPSEIPAKAEGMKTAMIQKYGQEIAKQPDVLNKAVIEVVKQSLKPLVEQQLIKGIEPTKAITRLVEEQNCTFTPISPAIKHQNDVFIKRATAGDFWGGAEPFNNACIGQKGNSYISYGQRELKKVISERNQKYSELNESNYAFLVSVSASTKGITIDNSIGNACENARSKGLIAFFQYIPQCMRTNIVQRELSDYVTNSFTFEAVGLDHYIDTESRKNDDFYKGLARFQNDDFDPILIDLFKTIKVNPTYGDVPADEYLKSIGDTYDVNKVQQDSVVNAFFSPIQTLRNKMKVMTEEDPYVVRDAFKEMFIKGVKTSGYMIGLGLGGSAVNKVLEATKDKSSKSDAGYSGKGDSLFGKLFSGFFKLLSAAVGVGIMIFYASASGIFYLSMPKIVFITLGITFFADAVFQIINAPMEAKKYAQIDDMNNFQYHGMKLVNNILYLMLTPTILSILFMLSESIQTSFMVQVGYMLLKYPTSTLMESIAFTGMSVVALWSVSAIVLVKLIHGYLYIRKELFGIDNEESATVMFVINACMFIIKWSLPLAGSLIFKMFRLQ